MDKIEDHIIAHFTGDETADDACQLSDWIRARPENAKRFAEMALMHGHLRGLLSGEAKVREIGFQLVIRRKDSVNDKLEAHPTLRRSRVILAAVAASLLIVAGVVGVAVFRDGDGGDRGGGDGGQIAKVTGTDANVTGTDAKVVATLVQSSNADWEGTHIEEGSPLHPQMLSLRSGVVRLEFLDGVEVTLQGPAKYEVIAVGRTRLLSGLLTAIVPPGAEGFQVVTPTAEVIDLGTAFGIELDDSGVAKVSVFDGEVEVRPVSNHNKRVVQEGESVRVTKENEIESSEFDGVAFEKTWPVSSGIAGSTGAFRFAPQWPRRLRFVQSDSDIFVLPEGYAQTLDEPIRVNITAPGTYHSEADLTAGTLPARTRVKCFLLQFNPVEKRNGVHSPTDRPNANNLNPDDLKRIVGEITFDRVVLGLIVRGEDLRASDGRFSERGGRVPEKGRALELSGTPRDDFVTLSADRHTVKLDLAAFGQFSDHVRVIVDQPLVTPGN